VRTVVLEPGVTGMAHDREQPGAALPTVKAAKEFPGAHVRLLDHLFRIVVIPGPPACQMVRRIQRRLDPLFKTFTAVVGLQTPIFHDVVIVSTALYGARLLPPLLYSHRTISRPPPEYRHSKTSREGESDQP